MLLAKEECKQEMCIGTINPGKTNGLLLSSQLPSRKRRQARLWAVESEQYGGQPGFSTESKLVALDKCGF